ncbi:MAG: class A beta-lactamase-related serine hydrolase [Chloroflexi bacterium]|nr:class A beta-lactamase-related serine hydrolase [Chloroflexota bacterium]
MTELTRLVMDSPDRNGLDTDRLRRAFGILDGWIQDRVVPGIGAIVAREGRVVAEAYFGTADRATGRPVDDETIWSVASVTKPFTAAVVMRAVDAGLLSVDEPVATLVPELLSGTAEDRGDFVHFREHITIRHCLSHSSGLPGFSAANFDLRRGHRPLSDFVQSFARAPQLFEPMTAHLYSNCGILMAAEVAGRVLANREDPDRPVTSGVAAFHEGFANLLTDLGTTSSSILPPPEWAGRTATVVDTGQEGTSWEAANSAYYRSLGIPWGGLFTTPRELVTFLAVFRPRQGGATSTGQRILSVAAVREMVSVQASGPDFGREIAPELRDSAAGRSLRSAVPWGIGWDVKGGKPAHPTGDLTSPGTWSHTGATGTLVWSDPVADVQVVLLTNRTLGSGWTRERPRQALFSNAVMSAVR